MKYDYSKVNPKDFEVLVSKQFRAVKEQGFIIKWRGQRVVPANGNVEIYPSRAAAIDALERNIHISMDAFNILAKSYGYNTGKPNEFVVGTKTVNYFGKEREETVYHDDYSKIRKISGRVLHFCIQQWLKDGTLTIEQI